MWDKDRRNWVSRLVQLPFINGDAVLLVPKYIVRRRLSVDSQEFYNKQITDFLVAENLRANSSLVQTVKGEPKVFKGDVREQNPKSKNFIAEMVLANPELLELYKKIAKKQGAIIEFGDDGPTLIAVCRNLADMFAQVPAGHAHADDYHNLVMGALTALFYPDLILPEKEWEIHEGRKRIDLVFTNAADNGFFSQRRNDRKVGANVVIIECKNYSNDLANQELDQLLGRFDENRGKFGLITCRALEDGDRFLSRCKDAAVRSQGYVIALTDADIVQMLRAKSELRDSEITSLLHTKFRELLS
jgi:hypothetical protein